MSRIQNGAVVITGAASGIGRCAVDQLEDAGYRVFAGVRKQEDAQRLAAEKTERVIPCILDITRAEQIKECVVTVNRMLKPSEGIKGLINNAGIGVGGPLEFIGIDDLARQLEINVVAQVAMAQAFLPLIRKEQGRIINIGSMAGRIALPFSGPYAASKAALKMLSDSLRRELWHWNIHVVLIEAGSVDTPIWKKSFEDLEQRAKHFPKEALKFYEKPMHAMNNYMKRLLHNAIAPEKVARVVLKAMCARRPKTNYIVGPDAYLGLISSFLPARLIDLALKREQKTA